MKMKLKFEIDTDELYGENGIDFEGLLSDSLRRSIVKDCKDTVASNQFKEFARLTSETIISGIKLRMEKFLSEEIAISDGWGKPTFVGTVEDLIKLRFDDILLRTVNSNGETIKGCTTSGQTWLEWKIGQTLNNKVETDIKYARNNIEKFITQAVNSKINDLKNDAIKQEVDSVFASILKRP
jgi:hypothetical protein